MTYNKPLILLGVLCAMGEAVLATPAFPGAEGAGSNALGGRGGDVYYVTTLADSGLGSLRTGISTAPAGGRTICFKVSGNIELNSTLTINRPRITIAGQTAPGDGICLQNYAMNVSASDVVVRHLRSRLGTNRLAEADAYWINAGSRIILDHCSASWSVDETLSSTANAADVTVQWCYITESLNNSVHVKGAHGYGSIIGAGVNTAYSWHHNLYAHHNSRNPRLGSSAGALFRLDFVNNVIYNWGNRAGYSGGTTEFSEMNYVANYLVAGPSKNYNFAFEGGGATTTIFQSGNFMDLTMNGLLDGLNREWRMFNGSFTPVTTPFAVEALATDPAVVAYQRVLAQAGAMPWRRDAADVRVTETVRTLTGQIIDDTTQVGGWPVLNSESPPLDTDSDGMPDYWECTLGLNTNNASDRNLTDGQGYTRLENYLNWLADLHAVCPGNGEVDVDLRQLNGATTNLAFTVVAGTNGTVTLLADGYTARFTGQPGFSGLGGFTFNAIDAVNGSGFGPVEVGVLVLAGGEPPLLNWNPAPDGIEFSWTGSWKLQSQTNVSGAGLGTNWVDYPESDNPITVPFNPGLFNAWFRLAHDS